MEAVSSVSSEENACRDRFSCVLHGWLGVRLPLFRGVRSVSDAQLRAAGALLGVAVGPAGGAEGLWGVAEAAEGLREARRKMRGTLEGRRGRWMERAKVAMETESGSGDVEEQKAHYEAKWGVPRWFFGEAMCKWWIKWDKESYKRALLLFLVTLERMRTTVHVSTFHVEAAKQSLECFDDLLRKKNKKKYSRRLYKALPNVIVGGREEYWQKNCDVIVSRVGVGPASADDDDDHDYVFSAVRSNSNNNNNNNNNRSSAFATQMQDLISEASEEMAALIRSKDEEITSLSQQVAQLQRQVHVQLPHVDTAAFWPPSRWIGKGLKVSALLSFLLVIVSLLFVFALVSLSSPFFSKILLHVGDCALEFHASDFGKVFMYVAQSPCTELKQMK